MKLVSRESFRSGEWIHGVDKFDDGAVIPWSRLGEDVLIGQVWYWDSPTLQWQVRQKQNNALVV